MNLFERLPVQYWRSFVTGVLLTLPWLEPWAPGPLPNVVPLLISWSCIGLLMTTGQRLQALDIARAWAIAATVSSAMGLLQYFGLADAFGPWVHVPDFLGEAQANLRQRNQLATLTTMGILAVLWWTRKGLQLPHALWMLALIATGNAATNSRTGLLQMFLVTALVFWWSRTPGSSREDRSWPLTLWALAVYAFASWALPHLLSISLDTHITSALTRLSHDDGCGSRKVLWRNVLELIGQKPWWGWGWDELKYAHYSASYSSERFCDILGNAHNGPLQLAFALGIPVATLITLGVIVTTLALRPWKSRQTQHQLAWGVLAVVGLHSLLEFPLWYGPFQMAVLLCVVLLMQPLTVTTAQKQNLRVAGVGILMATLIISIDYVRVSQIFLPAQKRWHIGSASPLELAQSSLLFQGTARFAEFTLTPVSSDNAANMLKTGEAVLHYSPEPKVIRQVIKAATLAGDDRAATLHRQQLKIAFPQERVEP